MAARLDDGSDLAENHEINVTPFIDVMLVLLIIFMVAAPLATVDVPVDLPGSTAAATPRPEKPLFVTVGSDLSISVGEEKVEWNALASRLDAATGGDKGERIFLRADKTVAYGDLAAAMNLLRSAGYLKVALVGIEQAATGS
ncbi:TonB system transport protein ExbD [Pleomorphomonas oryzae]|uniref:TonB system transport protein ExbD n=1 Tax=Pleomorphomonas oryzae TaxID=261934 RepID=UPI0003FA535C|nr:TonB system transport protein ExbD [Pleomorphomonas oryzae]